MCACAPAPTTPHVKLPVRPTAERFCRLRVHRRRARWGGVGPYPPLRRQSRRSLWLPWETFRRSARISIPPPSRVRSGSRAWVGHGPRPRSFSNSQERLPSKSHCALAQCCCTRRLRAKLSNFRSFPCLAPCRRRASHISGDDYGSHPRGVFSPTPENEAPWPPQSCPEKAAMVGGEQVCCPRAIRPETGRGNDSSAAARADSAAQVRQAPATSSGRGSRFPRGDGFFQYVGDIRRWFPPAIPDRCALAGHPAAGPGPTPPNGLAAPYSSYPFPLRGPPPDHRPIRLAFGPPQ